MTGRVPLRAQEIEDVPRLDAEVAGELLNLDTACRCGCYGELTSKINWE
jgi:hypothetical protein